ncbi:hypothetical protein QCA50_014033 [Cerrena zonata]|uniref:Uncharacterized protein n=1 Tax=Cerrena zonata TaxID=2478898 RepID=A0AAW0FVU0_9APHY
MSQFASIDEVSQPALEVPSSWLQDGGEAISMDTEYENHESIPFRNSGDADDLEIDELYEEPNNGAASNQVAGMHVDVGFAPIVGSVRRRDDNETSEDEFSKTRRLRSLVTLLIIINGYVSLPKIVLLIVHPPLKE